MNKTTLILLSFLMVSISYSQIGIGTSNPDASAALDISSVSGGLLLPRMTETQRDAISSPVAGLIVFCSNCGTAGELQIYNGSTYTNVTGGAASAPLTVGTSYGGGVIAYIFQIGDTGYVAGETHGIIASSTDLSNGIYWGPTNDGMSTGYDCINSHNSSAYALPCAIGTGESNTSTILSVQNGESTAAKLCSDYSVTSGGTTYDDWFLPSKLEMAELVSNSTAIGGLYYDSSAGEWAPENYYWTSTGDIFQDRAATQRSTNGYNNRNFRNELCSVRAVRYF